MKAFVLGPQQYLRKHYLNDKHFFQCKFKGGWWWKGLKGSIYVVQSHLNWIATSRVNRRHSFPDLDPRLVSDHGDDEDGDVGDDDYLDSCLRIFQDGK